MKTLRPLFGVLVSAALAGCGSSVSEPTSSAFGPFDAPDAPVIDEQSAPVVSAISPDTGSPAMEVSIFGSGFVPGAMSVFFGGIEAEIVSASSTELRVHPAAPSAGVRGETPVTVVSGDRTSNAITFHLLASGDVVTRQNGSHVSADDVVLLADGSVAVLDATRSAIYRIDANGWSRRAMGAPNGATRLSAQANGSLLLSGDGIWSANLATGVIETLSSGSWARAVEHDGAIYALRADGSAIDRLSGGNAEAFMTTGECADAFDFAMDAENVFVATSPATICVAAHGGEPAAVTLSEQTFQVNALRTVGGIVQMSGYSGVSGDAVSVVAADGSMMVRSILPTATAAFDGTENGIYVSATVTGQILESGDGWTMLATPLTGISAQTEDGSRVLVATGFGDYDFPALAEIRADGAVRVIASSEDCDVWTSITVADGEIYLASSEEGLILRAENGTMATVADHSFFGEIDSMVRLADGTFLVADGIGVASYGAEGESNGYVVELEGANGLATNGSEIWIAAGTTVSKMPVGGGDVTTAIGESAGFSGLNAVTFGVDGTIYVADGANTGAIVAVAADSIETMAHGDSVVGLTMDGFGRVLVADGGAAPYVMLP